MYVNIPNSFKEFANIMAGKIYANEIDANTRYPDMSDVYESQYQLAVMRVLDAGGNKCNDVAVSKDQNIIHISVRAFNNPDYIYYLLIWAYLLLKSKEDVDVAKLDVAAFTISYKDDKLPVNILKGFSMLMERNSNNKYFPIRHDNLTNEWSKLIKKKVNSSWAESTQELGEYMMKKSTTLSQGGMVLSEKEKEDFNESCETCHVEMKVHPSYYTGDVLFCPRCGVLYRHGIKI